MVWPPFHPRSSSLPLLPEHDARFAAPDSIALRISARVRPRPACFTAWGERGEQPASPADTARSGLITGTGIKCRHRAPIAQEPCPQGTRLAGARCAEDHEEARRRRARAGRAGQSPNTVGPSRPKKMPASSASSGRSPRWARGRDRCLAAKEKRASMPASISPSRRPLRPSLAKATVTGLPPDCGASFVAYPACPW